MLSLTIFKSITLFGFISAHISSLFTIIPKTDLVYPNSSLVPKTSISKMSKLNCLRNCVLNEFCSYIVFKNGFCILYTEYAKKGFISSTIDSVYEKKLIIEYFFKIISIIFL